MTARPAMWSWGWDNIRYLMKNELTEKQQNNVFRYIWNVTDKVFAANVCRGKFQIPVRQQEKAGVRTEYVSRTDSRIIVV